MHSPRPLRSGTDPGKLPARIQPAQAAGTRYLVLLNIEIIDLAGRRVACQEAGLISIAADVAKADKLPLRAQLPQFAHRAHLVVLDVEIVELTAVAVADQHVGLV